MCLQALARCRKINRCLLHQPAAPLLVGIDCSNEPLAQTAAAVDLYIQGVCTRAVEARGRGIAWAWFIRYPSGSIKVWIRHRH